MLSKFTIVLTMMYLITFDSDYRHRVLHAEQYNNSRPPVDSDHRHRMHAKKYNNSRPKGKIPTFRDLPIKKLMHANQIGYEGQKGGYMRVVNQLKRINATREQLKLTVTRQNKTIFRQQFMLNRQEKELRRQRDKIHTYKAQIRSYQAKLIDKGVVSDIIIVSAEDKKSKKLKKGQNVTDELIMSENQT